MDPTLDPAKPETDLGLDRTLTEAARDGDLHAFDRLVRRHYPRVYRILRRLLGRAEDAEDAAQEVMIAVWKNLSRFRGESAFTSWLYAVTVRRGYSTARSGSRHLADPMEEDREIAADAEIDPASIAERHEESDRIRRAMARLPEQQRQVATLYYYGEASCREIAEELGVRESTVRGQLRRARETLRRLLPDLREDER